MGLRPTNTDEHRPNTHLYGQSTGYVHESAAKDLSHYLGRVERSFATLARSLLRKTERRSPGEDADGRYEAVMSSMARSRPWMYPVW